MNQNILRSISALFLDWTLATSAILFTIIVILPFTTGLLNSAPSSLGWAELIVFLSHVIIGLSSYFILSLLNKVNNRKIIFAIVAIYFVILDIDIFIYKKTWLIVAILIVRLIQFFLLSVLLKMDFTKFKLIAGILIIMILILWYFTVKEF